MKVPHPVPYQGSKRNIAIEILKYLPKRFNHLIEPFAGSAAVSIAAAYHAKADKFIINDINKPLSQLLHSIINNPVIIADCYHHIWEGQLQDKIVYYNTIRQLFNTQKQPEYLLFLLAKCVKAAVRYNAAGDFNQGQDKRRLGKLPDTMREDIYHVSQLLKGKTEVFALDYQDILNAATINDVIYMDPPYQGTGLNGGFNYGGTIDHKDFIYSLVDLNQRQIPYMLSYNGRTGDKTYGYELPAHLNLIKIEINAGRSSQATLLNRNEITFEALYISKSLVNLLNQKKESKNSYLPPTPILDYA